MLLWLEPTVESYRRCADHTVLSCIKALTFLIFKDFIFIFVRMIWEAKEA